MYHACRISLIIPAMFESDRWSTQGGHTNGTHLHGCTPAPGRGGTKVQRQYVHEGRSELCTPKLNERGVEKNPSPVSGFFMIAVGRMDMGNTSRESTCQDHTSLELALSLNWLGATPAALPSLCALDVTSRM